MSAQKRCVHCGEADVRPSDGNHDWLTCGKHLLKQRDTLREENESLRKLLAEARVVLRPTVEIAAVEYTHGDPYPEFDFRALQREEVDGLFASNEGIRLQIDAARVGRSVGDKMKVFYMRMR